MPTGARKCASHFCRAAPLAFSSMMLRLQGGFRVELFGRNGGDRFVRHGWETCLVGSDKDAGSITQWFCRVALESSGG